MSPATESDANPIRVALIKFLKAYSILKELSKSVFYRKADRSDEVPYVIVSKAAGTPEWTFDGPPLDNEVWLVKGVGSANQSDAIDRRCRALLNRDTDLEIEGRDFKSVFAISDVDYEDDTDGEQFQHVGAEYRIHSEEEE